MVSNRNEISRKLELHRNFWERKPTSRPLVSFQLEEYFVSKRFRSASPLLEKGRELKPEQLDVDTLLEEYERMYEDACKTGQDAFWVAEPFNGIPWLEAMLGCRVEGAGSSFIAHPFIGAVEELEEVVFDESNPWVLKYVEFVKKLTAISNGRFPVGQPILRGVSDVVGTMIGQTELIFALMETPEIVQNAFLKVADAQRTLVDLQYKNSVDFHHGHAIGFYHVWCPGKCIWYQEDLSALLSPDLFNSYVIGADQRIVEGYEYTMMHLHPVSFFIVDSILQLEGLKAVQINKDVGGPSIRKMVPVLRKVLEKKNLILFAELNKEEIDLIFDELPVSGLYLNIFASSTDDAANTMDYIIGKKQ